MNEFVLPALIAGAFLLLSCFLEAMVLYFFRISRLGRSFVTALLLNIFSILTLYLLWPLTTRMGIDTARWFPLFPMLWLVSVLVEFMLLRFLARHQTWTKRVLVVVVMNILSFLFLYLALSLM